eukprot:226028-Chlamydomonas_euryale.AAC.1
MAADDKAAAVGLPGHGSVHAEGSSPRPEGSFSLISSASALTNASSNSAPPRPRCSEQPPPALLGDTAPVAARQARGDPWDPCQPGTPAAVQLPASQLPASSCSCDKPNRHGTTAGPPSKPGSSGASP